MRPPAIPPSGLLAKKEALEQAIDQLKYDKAARRPRNIKRQLAGLLLELAKTQEAIDALQK